MMIAKHKWSEFKKCPICGNVKISSVNVHGEEHYYCPPREVIKYSGTKMVSSEVIGCGEVFHRGN